MSWDRMFQYFLWEPRLWADGTGRARGIDDVYYPIKIDIDGNWPIDDMDVQFPTPEPEVIDLASDDEAINGIQNMIIVSDDSD